MRVEVVVPFQVAEHGKRLRIKSLVVDPFFQTVQCERLIAGVELVGEHLRPTYQLLKISYAEYADSTNYFTFALVTGHPGGEGGKPG